jgi:hypothetical protein
MTTTSIYDVYLIHRCVNGISLNPREYVLDDQGRPREFSSKAAALEWAYEQGLPITPDGPEQVGAFAEIECCVCDHRYWEEEDRIVETCPECGNKDKERTVVLVPRHQMEHDDGLYTERPCST